MRKTPVYAITATLLGLFLLTSGSTYAQVAGKNTDWLEKQLNKLVIEEGDKSNAGTKKSTPKFDVENCQLKMHVSDDDASMGMDMAWRLKDIKKTSYKQEKNGQYTLVLDGPADKVGMNLGGLAISFPSNEEGRKNAKKAESSNSSFSLSTKDEALVQQIKQRFDELIQQCRKSE